MPIVPNSQVFSPASSGLTISALAPLFKAQGDTVLIGGRDIVLDLKPIKSPCPSACKFIQAYGVYVDSVTGGPCTTCRGRGFTYEQRQTIYRANIRWTNEPLDKAIKGGQGTPAGQVPGDFVRTKTVIESYNHIVSADGATIDGIKVKMFQPPRQTGFGGTLMYVITWWEDANKKVTNG